MAKNPKLDWFVNDWLCDPCVQRSSIPARGCWHEMLQYMAIMEPFGELRNPDGSPMSIGDIATLLRADKRSVGRWIKELEANGVFSRTEDGAIYSRRLVRERDKQRAPKRKTSAKGTPRERSQDQQLGLWITDTPKTQEASLPSQDSPSPESSDPECAAARDEPIEPVEQEQSRSPSRRKPEVNPEARCARLGGAAAPPAKRRRTPCRAERPPKTEALKTRIKEQLRQKHARFLAATAPPTEFAAYWAVMLNEADPAAAQRLFDEVDRRMRVAGWDDMREWKRQHGIAA